MSIKITTDSPADLPRDIQNKYNISIIPLHIILGNDCFDDGVTVTPEDIYYYYGNTKNLPKTASVSIAEYSDFFKELTANGDEVIHFSLSSGISSTYHNAVLASSEMDGVHIVDSKSLTTGMALVIIKAAEMAMQGMCACDIVSECEKLINKVKTTFIVSNLEFLYKGGRCSGVAAFGANVLGIKPSIVMNPEGTLVVDKKYRGKFDSCIIQYIDDLIAGDVESIDTDRAVFVRTAGVSDELFNTAVDEVAKKVKFKEIIKTTAGCTITSHCGKGTFAFQFMRK